MDLSNYCILPFNSLSFDARGQLRPCCNSWDAGFDIFIKDLEPSKILNNEKIIQIRKDLKQDIRTSACNRCWTLEDRGVMSYRKVHNETKHYSKTNKPLNLKEILDFDDIEYLDITLGNKCNLACRMCNMYSSSLMAKNMIEVGLYVDHSDKKGLIDFSENEENKILDIIRKSKNLNHIYFIGGEPLINDFHDKIINLLIELGIAGNVWLQYNTNMQIDVKKYFSYWKHFKKCEINASIDGTDSIYEYIRWPGRFAKVFENMTLMAQYKKEHPNMHVGISTVTQNLNVTNMIELIDRFETLNLIGDNYWFIDVTGVNHLECVPTYILEQQINLITDRFPNVNPWRNIILNYETAYEKSKNLSYDMVRDFFYITEKYDRYRKQNLFHTLPFMKDLANAFEIQTW